MTNKLYRVSITLSKDGWREVIRILNVTEKNKTFYIENGYTIAFLPKSVKKEKLLAIDSMVRESHKEFSFYTWCMSNDVAYAKGLLREHILKRLCSVKNEIEAVYSKKDNTDVEKKVFEADDKFKL